ncbi:Gfo/Idh/MocA family oxidoreductase [Isosphaeraceae bacterium EP7]
MKIAIIGCGFVADFYLQSLRLYPSLELEGVFDRDLARGRRFAAFYSVGRVYTSLDEILDDRSIDLVLNLTNPRDHYAISKACLTSGKSVYSEKPLAMEFDQARELVVLAEKTGVQIACAPGSILGETAQSIWHALRANVVGNVRLVYAEMDDGMVFKAPYQHWKSSSGTPWPYKDEFEVGCTLEHAGYYVNWLTAFFGPATSVTAFSSCLYPDKTPGEPLDQLSPDFSVACIRFASGTVARLTCSLIAPEDQRLRFFGDEGILSTKHAWNYREPVRVSKLIRIRRKLLVSPFGRKYPLVRLSGIPAPIRKAHPMEFSRAPALMAAAIEAKQPSPIPMDYCLHNNEIALAIHHALELSDTVRLTTSFEPLQPLPLA